jgi:serine/threonine protein kinase/Tfp pilus assembly protein PilF
MNETRNRVRSIFLNAVENVPPERWAAYLDEVCGNDPDLRARVEALLQADQNADSLLGGPEVMEHAEPVATAPVPGPPAEGPGAVIGPYKLLEVLGEGGMGVVYKAEQTQPVRRQVALKIIKPGMDTRQVIARFEAERQALALMDHPSIARVLDAGATEHGCPYFVMELVKGVPITTYCDTVHLTTRDRLELFIPVCQAIQHAHQKGIIHRDIKPTNVMITMVDGKPAPKVIDFGVAKAIDQRLTERTIFTQHGAIVGTFEYMSPEQAELSGLDIDTRSDIYALGVLLYELLAGSTPLEKEKIRQAAYSEILRLIREEEPPKPSTRLSDSGDSLPSLAAQRRTEPARLAKQVRGDLDWIVMKAIDKDRTRRYETANGLARNIQRHLDGDPVDAGPPSAWYKLRKFGRKHRAVLVTTASFAALLLIAAALSTYLAIRATNAERLAKRRLREVEQANTATTRALAQTTEAKIAAQAAEKSARGEAEKSKAINNFLTEDLLTQADPNKNSPENRITLLEVLDRAAEKVGERFRDKPELEEKLRLTIAETYLSLASWPKAEHQWRAALQSTRLRLGADSSEALVIQSELAAVQRDRGLIQESLPLAQQAFEGLARVLGPDHHETLEAENKLAGAYRAAGRIADAIKLLEEVLRLKKAKLGANDPSTLQSLSNLAVAYHDAGRTADAIPLMEESLKLHEAKTGPDSPGTLTTRNNLGTFYDAVGRTADAIKMLELALNSMVVKPGPDHPLTLACRVNLAKAYRVAGRTADAIKMAKETVQLMTAKLGAGHPSTLIALNNLAKAYEDAGRTTEAIKLYEHTLQVQTSNPGAAHPSTATTRNNLAAVYGKTGQFAKAEALFREALEHARKRYGAEDSRTADVMSWLGRDLLLQQRFTEAEPVLRECLKIREKSLPDDWARSQAKSLLGGALLGQRRFAEAEPLLVTGYEGLKARTVKRPPPPQPYMAEAAKRIVQLYRALGKPEKSDALLRPEDRDALMPNGAEAFAR